MTKIEKLAMECASGKQGDAYDAAKSACLELGDIIKEYLGNKVKAYKCRGEDFFGAEIKAIEEIINELFKER